MTQNYLESVKQQYEALPYPPRDPADEKKRLIQTVGDNLLIVNHFCFGGRRDFRSNFRCLVAGGGTGDSLIYLAEQLRFFDGEVVYLDLSGASRAIAEARAKQRGLTNIRWVTASIMDIPQLGLGEFDYVNCSGVLHHLESASAGLAALNTVLKNDGAMFLMLYGKYGRREIYDMQELLRCYLPPDLDIPRKVAITRRLLDALPPTNTFRRNLGKWEAEIMPVGTGDAGLYDLLLHSQDRSFDVPGLYTLATGEGLHVAGFPMQGDRYDPCSFIADAEVRSRLMELPLPQRQALAEKMGCVLRTHEFYLTRRGNTVASAEDESLAILLFWSLLGRHRWLAERLQPGVAFTYRDSLQTVTITGTEISKRLIARMDGNTPIGRVCEEIVTELPGTTRDAVRQELRKLVAFLNAAGCLYLLAPGSHANQLPDYRRSEYIN